MATKAELYRADQERKNQKPRARKTTPRRDVPIDAASRSVAANWERAELSGTALRNLTTSPSKQKGGPALEDSASGKASRKSTRSSAGHVKLASNLQRRQIRRTHSPQAKAARSGVR
jgi:hypothetical protein